MYITIEGNIGSGKTTVAKALAKKLKANFLPEQFEENTLLPLFYKNKQQLALLTEFSFLIDRQKQLSTYFKTQPKTSTVSDFHFDKCICFAKVNLNTKNYTLYKSNFKVIKPSVNEPDLVVFIDANTKLLLQNIKKRNRVFEQTINESYLKKVASVYKSYYSKLQKAKATVLIINIGAYTNNTVDECCNLILKTIASK